MPGVCGEALVIASRSVFLRGLLAVAVFLGTSASADPLQIWMIGSDIGSPDVILTHQLRDAFEPEVARDRVSAPSTGEHVYIPEFVRLHGKDFSYRAMLTRDDEVAVREAEGTCSRTAVQTCAHQILTKLGLEHS